MAHSELAHLELLAEVDGLVDRLNRWADAAPEWQPAERCQALVRRLSERAASLRVRLESPLVVALLGGTGVGKSALVNAIVGEEVVQTGRARPTTMRPTLVCRSTLTPEMLGIEPASVAWIRRDSPALRELVLIDCPDPDTTEEPPTDSAAAPCQVGSNLSRLRAILPKCDVLLVVATQQKYRSARVAKELLAAAPGARVVFVQTHADIEDDIREDWRKALGEEHVLPSPACGDEGGREAEETQPVPNEGAGPTALTLTLSRLRERGPDASHIFRIDSLAALAEARSGLPPRGEFADLLDLLTRQMAGAAANRIRRANFLDLTADMLAACAARIDETISGVWNTQAAVEEQRGILARQIIGDMQAGLLANHRSWENRLLGQAASRWGLSPFSLVLRAYQGLGGLLAGALLYRARTPAQMALWGAMTGVQTWRKHQETRHAERAVAGAFDPAEIRKASLVVDGYLEEAGLCRRRPAGRSSFEQASAEAASAAGKFVDRVSGELESLVARLAKRHTGWFTRFRYEVLLVLMLGLLFYRLGKNFFYDSWLVNPPAPVFGLEFYLAAGFWLVLWCLLLLWAFTSRLRRGLRGEIGRLATAWQTDSPAAGLFAHVEAECRGVERFRQELLAMRQEVDDLRQHVARAY